MSAGKDQKAEERLSELAGHRTHLVNALREHHRARLRFVREARSAGWPWSRIGDALDLTDRGAASWWKNHRMEASRLGG